MRIVEVLESDTLVAKLLFSGEIGYLKMQDQFYELDILYQFLKRTKYHLRSISDKEVKLIFSISTFIEKLESMAILKDLISGDEFICNRLEPPIYETFFDSESWGWHCMELCTENAVISYKVKVDMPFYYWINIQNLPYHGEIFLHKTSNIFSAIAGLFLLEVIIAESKPRTSFLFGK